MEQYMRLALIEAVKAEKLGEVPAGAIIIDKVNGEVLGSGYNQVITMSDPTAHAEIIAIRDAAQKVKNYRLKNTILFTTLEPCPMCLMAAIHARIDTIYYGALEPKWGALGSLINLLEAPKINHTPGIIGGMLADEASSLITDFFKKRRLAKKDL